MPAMPAPCAPLSQELRKDVIDLVLATDMKQV